MNKCLIFLLILAHVVCLVTSQGGAGADDGSSSDTSQDTQSAGDPNILTPTNKQGYGRNVQTSLKKAQTAPMKISAATTDIAEQSIQAVLQFGVLVGVALLVGILFMLNIGLDLLCDAVQEKLSEMFGKKKVADPENPAALVGTFKRYK